MYNYQTQNLYIVLTLIPPPHFLSKLVIFTTRKYTKHHTYEFCGM